MISTDEEAYKKYSHHHTWFNKLYLAERMNYTCGPCGVAPDQSNYYVVRPIYNLSGMGIGARVEYIESGDTSKVEPGYFWCEFITGIHYSTTYRFVHDIKPRWEALSCWRGYNHSADFTKFTEWKRSTYIPPVPAIFNELSDVSIINIEFKGDQPIEVHLRQSPDPQYDHMIPTWKNDGDWSARDAHLDQQGYKWIPHYDDGDGFLTNPRTGFWVK